MVTPAVAAYVPSYVNRVDYLTVQEYLNSPNGVDTTRLKPTGSFADQGAILKMLISRASGWVDSICHQVIAATADTQVGMYRLRRDGTVWVPVDYSPLVAVTSVQWGWEPSSLTALTDLSKLWIQRKVVQIQVIGTPPDGSWLGQAATGRVYMLVGYINGYANTLLSAPVTAAGTSLTVDSALGIAPGEPLTIYDGSATESVQVDPSYVFGASPVPLLTPLLYEHDTGTAVSALPPQVKEATIELTSALIRVRGAQALTMQAIDAQPTKTELVQSGGQTNVAVAKALLTDFIRVR